MTAAPELLPLPQPVVWITDESVDAIKSVHVKDSPYGIHGLTCKYAKCVNPLYSAETVDALQAEIERLQAEVERSERYAEQSERERLRVEERAERLEKALRKVAQALEWFAHGRLRGFDDGPLLSTSEAVELAERTLAKVLGHDDAAIEQEAGRE